MDLQDHVRPELWAAIAESYTAQEYTAAIRGAISLVTEVLRDKTGLDGDGQDLVGKALGFTKTKPPLLALNKLQTETERNVQLGLLETLKGIYSLIRNPRSHERYQDDKQTADAIILFINYLLGFLGEAQQTFTPEGFLSLVVDPYFARDEEYVDGLIGKVPVRKLYDTLVAVYRMKSWQKADNFSLVVRAIIPKLDHQQTSDFLEVVSNDLQHATKEADISLAIKVLPPELWPQVNPLPKLRIENALLSMLAGAWYIPDSGKTNSVTSTWIRSIARQFTRKGQLRQSILSKLGHDDFDHHNFVAQYLLDDLPDIFESEDEIRRCADAISGSIRKGNQFLKNCLVAFIQQGPPQPWIDTLRVALKEFTDPDNPEIYLYDGNPLFGQFTPRENPHPKFEEDEIPF